MTRLRRAILVAILLASHGCSWAFVSTAPSSARAGGGPPVVCTESRNAPIADLLLGGLGAALAAQTVVKCGGADPDADCGSTWPVGVVYGVALAIIHGLSAEYGFRHTSRCRRVHARP